MTPVTRYAVGHADIAHQRVDNEVIAINLRTGAYFSLRDAAADAWELLAGRVDAAETSVLIAARYDADASTVLDDLAPFIARLLDEGLIAEADRAELDRAAPTPPTLAPVDPGTAYHMPRLDKYEDMEELLLLDPIHDVDAEGWPVVATEPTE